MFAKGTVKRVRNRRSLRTRYAYARASGAVLGESIWRMRFRRTSSLWKKFTKKSAKINEKFFKVISCNISKYGNACICFNEENVSLDTVTADVT